MTTTSRCSPLCCARKPSSEETIDAQTISTTARESCWGRVWKRLHCSQISSGGGAVVSLAMTALSALVAYASTPEKPLTFGVSITVGVFSLCSFVTNTIGMIYLCAWKPQKKLEQNIQQLQGLTQSAADEVTALKKRVEELEALNQQLASVGKQHEITFQQQQATLSQKITEIDSLNQKVSTITKSLEVAQKLVKQWQQAAQAIQAATSKFSSIDLEKATNQLSETLLQDEKIAITIQDESAEMTHAQQAISEQNTVLQNLISTIKGSYSTLLTDISTKQGLLASLKQEVSNLQSSLSLMEAQNKKLTELKETAERLNEEYKKTDESLTALLPLLKSINMEQLQAFISQHSNQ